MKSLREAEQKIDALTRASKQDEKSRSPVLVLLAYIAYLFTVLLYP